MSRQELTNKVKSRINFHRLATHRSTLAEITTALLGLQSIPSSHNVQATVSLYSDCANLVYLLGARKEKLLACNFFTKAGNKLAHAELYKTLFAETEKFDLTVFKLKGHSKNNDQLSVQEKIFSILDQEARKTLRQRLLKTHCL